MHIGEALSNFKSNLAPEGDLSRLQTVWREIVGEQIARACRPVDLVDGVLKIECTSSVWSHEIDLLSEQIVVNVNSALGQDLITSVRVSLR